MTKDVLAVSHTQTHKAGLFVCVCVCLLLVLLSCVEQSLRVSDNAV